MDSLSRTRMVGFVAHVAALGAGAAAACVALGVRDLSPSLTLTSASASCVLLAPLFWRQSRQPAELAAWCIAAALLGPVLTSIWVPVRAIAVMRTALVAGSWIALTHAPLWARACCSAARCGAASGESRAAVDAMRAVLVTLLSALGSTLVWLDPLASSSSGSTLPATLTLAASPLVHLAVAADADLLRAPWLYASTALGSSRFEYPDLIAVAAADAALAALAWIAASRWSRWRTRRAPRQASDVPGAAGPLSHHPDPESLP